MSETKVYYDYDGRKLNQEFIRVDADLLLDVDDIFSVLVAPQEIQSDKENLLAQEIKDASVDDSFKLRAFSPQNGGYESGYDADTEYEGEFTDTYRPEASISNAMDILEEQYHSFQEKIKQQQEKQARKLNSSEHAEKTHVKHILESHERKVELSNSEPNVAFRPRASCWTEDIERMGNYPHPSIYIS